jgi:hypothetical protein
MVGLIYSCQKEQSSVQPSIPISSQVYQNGASDRDEVEVAITKVWLQSFQNSLNAAVLNTPNVGIVYTPDEMAAGVEALLNLAATSQTYTSQEIKVSAISVDYSSNSIAIKEVYTKSLGAFNEHLMAFAGVNASPIAIDVRIASQEGSTLNLKVTTIIGINSSSEGQIDDPCGRYGDCPKPFSANEAYRVGGGDQELSLQFYYWNPNCEGACGTALNCQAGSTTAYEQIESRINSLYPLCKSPCPPNSVVKFYSINYKFVDDTEFTSIFDDNSCTKDATRIGDCMNSQELNCKFCSIYNRIGQAPLNIPSGSAFVSINLGLNNTPCCGGVVCQYSSFLSANFYYGKYGCFIKPDKPGGELDGLKLDLTTLNF